MNNNILTIPPFPKEGTINTLHRKVKIINKAQAISLNKSLFINLALFIFLYSSKSSFSVC